MTTLLDAPKKNEAVDAWFEAVVEAIDTMSGVLDGGCHRSPSSLACAHADLHMHIPLEDAVRLVEKSGKGGKGAPRGNGDAGSFVESIISNGKRRPPGADTPPKTGESDAGDRHSSGSSPAPEFDDVDCLGDEPLPKRAHTTRGADDPPEANVDEQRMGDEQSCGGEPPPERARIAHADDAPPEEDTEDHEARRLSGEVRVDASEIKARLRTIREYQEDVDPLEAYLAVHTGIDSRLIKHAALAVRRLKHFYYMTWKGWDNKGYSPAVVQSVFWACMDHISAPHMVKEQLFTSVEPLVDFVVRSRMFDPFFAVGHTHWACVFMGAIPQVVADTDQDTNQVLEWRVCAHPLQFVSDGIFDNIDIPHPLIDNRRIHDTRVVALECMRQYGKTTAAVLYTAVFLAHCTGCTAELKVCSQEGMKQNVGEMRQYLNTIAGDRLHFLTQNTIHGKFYTDRNIHRFENAYRGTSSSTTSSRGLPTTIAYVDEASFMDYETLIQTIIPHLRKKYVCVIMTTTPSHNVTHALSTVFDSEPRGLWVVRFRSACRECIDRGEDYKMDCMHMKYAQPSQFEEQLPVALKELIAADPDTANAEIHGYAANRPEPLYATHVLRTAFGFSDMRTYQGNITHLTSTAHMRTALDLARVKHYLDSYKRLCELDEWSLLMVILFRIPVMQTLVSTARHVAPHHTTQQIVDMLWVETALQTAVTRCCEVFMAKERNQGKSPKQVFQALLKLFLGFSQTEAVGITFKKVVGACVDVAKRVFTPAARMKIANAPAHGNPALTTNQLTFQRACIFVSCDLSAHNKSELTVIVHAYEKTHKNDNDVTGSRFVLLGIDSWLDCASDNDRARDNVCQVVSRVIRQYPSKIDTCVVQVEINSDDAKSTDITNAVCRLCASAYISSVPRFHNDHIATMSSEPTEPKNRAYGVWSTVQTWSMGRLRILNYLKKYPIVTDGEPITKEGDGRGWDRLNALLMQMAYQYTEAVRIQHRVTSESTHPYEIALTTIIKKSPKVLDDLAKTLLIAFFRGYEYMHYIERKSRHTHRRVYI